jgi:hypothetical protein
MGIAAPSLFLPRLTFAHFRGLFDNLNEITLEEKFIRRFLEISERAEHYLVRLSWQLMSNKAFHAAEEELRQQVFDQLFRRLPCLLQLMVCGVMATRVSERRERAFALTIALSSMDH